jgi:ABC-type multidrug transport system fused ATPase/permease subunit
LVDRKRRKKPAYFAVLKVTIAAGTAVMLWVGARHVFAGELSIGSMVIFASYSGLALHAAQQHFPDLRLGAERQSGSAKSF